ncbi:respiratory nitrate reductase subunit gamma [Rubrobacter calidifluminis]|uniref:respiratory nitrate reductase subunit gamma n=1 Tax=Rubrobacter calidifluminis TaxID=1392640 RepID=UPI00235EBA0E|nr:respiratory nitrate reductase subunit gamma [Rubrobacter calidifluminis]
MNLLDNFTWVIWPYLAMASFVVGHAFRYRYDQFGWTSESSELLEKRSLKWGSVLFHIGIIFAFLGHVMGILIPIQFYHAIGFKDPWYEILSLWAGTAAGAAALIGILIINMRRWLVKKVRRTTKNNIKFFIDFLLLVVIAIGLVVTLGYRIWVGLLNMPGSSFFGSPTFDYRTSIGPWARSLFSFAPDPNLMSPVPVIFKIHIILAFLLFALWPYSHLVHVWSAPIGYLRRRRIQYRSRNPEVAMAQARRRPGETTSKLHAADRQELE